MHMNQKGSDDQTANKNRLQNLKYYQDNGTYFGTSIAVNAQEVNNHGSKDVERQGNDNSGFGMSHMEDQLIKKQMSFRGGKMIQLITDSHVNNNKIFANRYQGLIGIWYFTIDSVFHFENLLAVGLLLMCLFSNQYNQVSTVFPMTALMVNVTLMCIRNLIFELRQRKVTNKINNKTFQYLMISRKSCRFQPIRQADVKPGVIMRIFSGQEFPADCLILDIQGVVSQKCFVTSGPFDDTNGIVQKKSNAATSNKTGQRHNEQNLADMISGLVKFEYNYFGYIQGTFKINENPAAFEFDQDNVVHRGQLLTQTPMVLCLVLNVGDQCISSVYKDPYLYMESRTNLNIRTIVKVQRSFDKAYKHTIRLFLLGLTILYLVFAGLAIYLVRNDQIFKIKKFEQHVMPQIETGGALYYIQKGLGFFSILLSSIPLSFSNIIDLLVLTHTNFAEWDINLQQASIEFKHPHATLAFGKVAHMFFSRQALQRDDKMYVKLFQTGGTFFLNKISQQHIQKITTEQNNHSFDSEEDNDSSDHLFMDCNSLDYLPNELKYSTEFVNSDADLILNGPNSKQKKNIIELFRCICLCNQASVQKDFKNQNLYKYIGVLHDELASLEFAQKQDFKLIQKGKKMITVLLQGHLEKYDELGCVTTKAVMGHFMTVGAVRLQGSQEGILYMKGSIASLKNYFIEQEKDFHYLSMFEKKFIESGVQSIVYAKRQLTVEETNKLIITINEGVHSTRESTKLDNLLYNLTSIQLEILGILGLQKAIHMRNRVVVDDMIYNGVKPWIVSKEDEQSHLTCLYSLQMFHNCASSLFINGSGERVVSDQILSALKTVTQRMSNKSSKNEDMTEQEQNIMESSTFAGNTAKQNSSKRQQQILQNLLDVKDYEKDRSHSNEKNKNVVLFTGKALAEILRDQTMIKLFMTLAYICDLMVGSEISPIQKQQLLKIARNYIGEGEYAAAIIATPEDQFMINEADLSANFKTKGKSSDIQAVVDVTFKDFSAVSYLLFKHGNQIQMRLSKASQAFFYRSLITFLILFTYILNSGFSGAIPYKDVYFIAFMIFLTPLEILIYAIFYVDYGYDYLYRIYGHYKYNFSFRLVETEFVIIDSLSAVFDWCIIYLPFEMTDAGHLVTSQDGKIISIDAYYCYQVIIMQLTFFMYLKNTNIQVLNSLTILTILSLLGISLIFNDEYMVGPQQVLTCPILIMQLVFQTLMLMLRNFITEVLSKVVLKRYANLKNWYANVEERLSYEQFEDPNQTFSIQQYQPLFQKINSSNIKNTLRLINTNMMKVTKNESIDQILDKINTELDNDMRSLHNISMRGEINYYTLQLTDLNKEAIYQDNKNQREIIYVKRQMIVFILNTFLFGLLGLGLDRLMDLLNIGVYFYFVLSVLSIMIYFILPQLITHLSNILLFYTIVIISCYTIYTAQSESLQPTGLIFVLALVAGLNHSFIYITMIMIIVSVLMHIFFSYLNEAEQKKQTGFVRHFGSISWIFTSLVWSSYVYIQEYNKKQQFVNGHKKTRQYLKLKSILNLMIPPLVREKISRGNKNVQDVEKEVSVVIIKLHKFKDILQQYHGHDLLAFMDKIYNCFDNMCTEQGLQKIESIGDTYMACGGLQSAEIKIEARFLNRHHTVRATDFAMAANNYVQTIIQKNGQKLDVRIAVHTGQVISGIFGEVKPQFCIVGHVVRKVCWMCHNAQPLMVTVSKQTLEFLELYTNNYAFINIKLHDRNKSDDVFVVQSLTQFQRTHQFDKNKKKNLYAYKNFNQSFNRSVFYPKKSHQLGDGQYNPNSQNIGNLIQKEKKSDKINDYTLSESGSVVIEDDKESANSQKKDKEQENLYNLEVDNESGKTDMVADGTMNVFGFNDDLNLDDRLIIQNPTENQIYNLVERTKFLLFFDLKDTEQEFLYTISKQEATKTTIYLSQLILLNKIVIFGDILQTEFQATPQFYLMFMIFILELILIYKLNNPQLQQIHFWTYLLLIYGIIVLGILLSYQIKYQGQWMITTFTELQIQLTLSLIFMMRNVLLRHFLTTYFCYFAAWVAIIVGTYLTTNQKFEYQIIQFVLGQLMYVSLLVIGIHHREMIQRKSLNYERILDVEINKTNELILKQVPQHMLDVINNEEKKIDDIENATILYIDMFGFTDVHREHTMDSKDYVNIMQRLFARFDTICEKNKVYKVYTLADCYVIMGYTGKINKNQRTNTIVFQEAHRVIITALEMLDTAQEILSTLPYNKSTQLNMRVGIHTGNIIAGIIGSKLVRYDIFGQGVLIAKEIEQRGEVGQVSISEDTKKVLMHEPEIAQMYIIKEHKHHSISGIGRKQVKSFTIQRREQDMTIKSSQFDSEMKIYSIGSKGSKKSHPIMESQIEDGQSSDGSDDSDKKTLKNKQAFSQLPKSSRQLIKRKNQQNSEF